MESYFLCETDTVLVFWLQTPTKCILLSTKFFLLHILTQRKIDTDLKQIQNTRNLNFAPMCKIEFWDTAIILGDIGIARGAILDVNGQKY